MSSSLITVTCASVKVLRLRAPLASLGFSFGGGPRARSYVVFSCVFLESGEGDTICESGAVMCNSYHSVSHSIQCLTNSGQATVEGIELLVPPWAASCKKQRAPCLVEMGSGHPSMVNGQNIFQQDIHCLPSLTGWSPSTTLQVR